MYGCVVLDFYVLGFDVLVRWLVFTKFTVWSFFRENEIEEFRFRNGSFAQFETKSIRVSQFIIISVTWNLLRVRTWERVWQGRGVTITFWMVLPEVKVAWCKFNNFGLFCTLVTSVLKTRTSRHHCQNQRVGTSTWLSTHEFPNISIKYDSCHAMRSSLLPKPLDRIVEEKSAVRRLRA